MEVAKLTRLAIAYSLAPLLHAQGNGTIHGTVTDPSGAAVPDAKVIAPLDERGTTREIVTSTGGEYVFHRSPSVRTRGVRAVGAATADTFKTVVTHPG